MTTQHYYQGTGKRKTGIAEVRLYPGGDSLTINGKPMDECYPWFSWQDTIVESLKATDQFGKYTVVAKVHGGGKPAQADAIRHGISRALLKADPQLRPVLKKNGFLTRDAREKERKKYGLKGARRAPQYTKR
jgi:small subunit ribosomal protein S9